MLPLLNLGIEMKNEMIKTLFWLVEFMKKEVGCQATNRNKKCKVCRKVLGQYFR
jgi:hypothetical protein